MSKKVKVTLVKSMIGRPEKQRRVLRAMGLNRIGRSVVLEDTPSNMGMINKVSHLVRAEENTDEAS
jgi:large subunit ribosomal protein L30